MPANADIPIWNEADEAAFRLWLEEFAGNSSTNVRKQAERWRMIAAFVGARLYGFSEMNRATFTYMTTDHWERLFHVDIPGVMGFQLWRKMRAVVKLRHANAELRQNNQRDDGGRQDNA